VALLADRRTTVLTLEDPEGVGDDERGFSPPGSPPSLDVVEPELTPLELWRTRLLGEWWMFLVEVVRVLRPHTDLMLPVPRRLALSKHKLDAKMEARTLCLLPNRT